MSPGQTGHITGQMGRVPGTDGTHIRGCPAKILYVYWFFSFPTIPLRAQRLKKNSIFKLEIFNPGPSEFPTKTGRPRFGSVRPRVGDGTVQAVPVFGSGGSSAKRVLLCYSRV